MNFTNLIKNEIIHNESLMSDGSIYELYGLFSTIGQLENGEGYIEVTFSTEIAFIARRIVAIIKQIYMEQPLVAVRKKRKKTRFFVCIVLDRNCEQTIYKYLAGEQIINTGNNMLESFFFTKKHRRDFIRGVFLGGGNFINPRVDYHMDITVKASNLSNFIIECLNGFGIEAKSISRGKSYIVYVNRMGALAEFLSVVGANNVMLEYENGTIIKEIRNKANREVNCITANLNKVIKTAVEQVQSILYIEKRIGIKQLPQNLQIAAKIRLEHPEESLADLTTYFDGLSKSGIRHRLKTICTIAEELKKTGKS